MRIEQKYYFLLKTHNRSTLIMYLIENQYNWYRLGLEIGPFFMTRNVQSIAQAHTAQSLFYWGRPWPAHSVY